MIRAGILSDTHISQASHLFAETVTRAFSDCTHIFHAGDLTDFRILECFAGKTVHAVHGNCCNARTRLTLPFKKLVELEGQTIALCHGAGPRHNIEERMWELFPEADCILFGHTHIPVCRKYGETLFINPGSFQCNPLGAPASYAVMTISASGITAELHEIEVA